MLIFVDVNRAASRFFLMPTAVQLLRITKNVSEMKKTFVFGKNASPSSRTLLPH